MRLPTPAAKMIVLIFSCKMGIFEVATDKYNQIHKAVKVEFLARAVASCVHFVTHCALYVARVALTAQHRWINLPMCAQRSRISAVLLDLDGVLIDSYNAWYHQFQRVLEYFGHGPVSELEFRRHWGQSTEDDVRIFMPERTVEEVRQYFYDHYDEYMQHLVVNHYARELLAELRMLKLHIGCVTNSHRMLVTRTLQNTYLLGYFEAIITADDVERPKPAPDMIVKVCRVLGVMPSSAVFIGDTETDLEAAARAGCIFVGYRMNTSISINGLEEFASWIKMEMNRPLSRT